MPIDLDRARAFMAANARLLDRRRFQALLGEGDPEAVLAAVDAYRNPDGGYGWGLEPDLRSPESQPGGALHAFEALADAAPATTPHAVALCDWLASVSLPDGGLPFALPVTDPAGCAPFWASADSTTSSLQLTAVVATAALRVAEHQPAVGRHPWLAGAIRYCLAAVDAVEEAPHAIELSFAVQLLDAVHDREPRAAELLTRLGRFVPPTGVVAVAGGKEGEAIRPLDFAPCPDRPARALFSPEVVAADLTRLRDGQRPDGGWEADYASYSPAAALEWRGAVTVRAVTVLRHNGMA